MDWQPQNQASAEAQAVKRVPPLSVGGSIGLILASILLGLPGALFSLIYAINAMARSRGSILPVVVIIITIPVLVLQVLILPWVYLFLVFNLYELFK